MSIEARDLRIGNLVMAGNSRVLVNGIHDGFSGGINPYSWSGDGDSGIDVDYEFSVLSGVPLTEDWLVKLGFVHRTAQDISWYSIDGKNGISLSDNKFNFITGNFVCQLVLREIQYVHELQNLYFSITGKELVIPEI